MPHPTTAGKFLWLRQLPHVKSVKRVNQPVINKSKTLSKTTASRWTFKSDLREIKVFLLIIIIFLTLVGVPEGGKK